MGKVQIIFILVTLASFAVLGFMLNRTIKQHEENKKHAKKKKGRMKYMQEAKKF